MTDYQDMLEQVRPDLALITTENCMHVEVAHACIERGVSVCVEKPMACDLAGALKIARLARERGVEVFVNWPIAWREWLYRMKDVLDSGRMGPLIKVRYLGGADGPLGPGALHRGTDGKGRRDGPGAKIADLVVPEGPRRRRVSGYVLLWQHDERVVDRERVPGRVGHVRQFCA